jgi:hypothetical protein
MTLFRDEFLTIQDEYLESAKTAIDPEDDEDVDYSNDDLGESRKITPFGDNFDDENDDIDDMYMPGPDDDDDDFDDEDGLQLDEDELVYDDEEELEGHFKVSAIGGDDEDYDDEDEDFFDDDDEIEDADAVPVIPDPDDDDDWGDDEDDTLDDDLEGEDDTPTHKHTGSTTEGLDPNFQIHHPERQTGRMFGHEPGTI